MKTNYRILSLNLNNTVETLTERAKEICDLLSQGWTIINSTGTQYTIVYILKKTI